MNRQTILKNRTRILLVLFVLIVLAFWAWGYFASNGLVDYAVNLIKRYSGENPLLSLLIFWIFAALSVLLGPFTSAPLVPIAILLWGDWNTFLLLFTGWSVGGFLAYLIGRYAGYAIVRRILSEVEVESWREFVSKKATFFIAFLFRLAMPAETGYVFGLVQYSIWKYLLITSIVEAPVAAALVFASDALVAQDLTKFISWVAIIFILLAASAYFLATKIKKLKN